MIHVPAPPFLALDMIPIAASRLVQPRRAIRATPIGCSSFNNTRLSIRSTPSRRIMVSKLDELILMGTKYPSKPRVIKSAISEMEGSDADRREKDDMVYYSILSNHSRA